VANGKKLGRQENQKFRVPENKSASSLDKRLENHKTRIDEKTK
jgi:hypothetical protein